MSDEPKEAAMEQGEAGKAKPDPSKNTSTCNNTTRLGLILVAVAAIVFLGVGLKVWHFDDDDNDEVENFNNDTTETKTFFSSTVDLPPVSARTLQQTYDTCDALKGDLIEVAKYLGEVTIERNFQSKYRNNYQYGGGFGPFRGEVDAMDDGAVPQASPTGGTSESIPTDESSYLTNNQVEGVDEADMVKSDGEFIYVAYGKDIVKLNADEVTVLDRVSLPENDDSSTCGLNSIQGMLLIGDRLVVVAAGYCNYWYGPMPVDLPVNPGAPMPFDMTTEGNDEARSLPPIIQGTGNTQVLIYDVATLEVQDKHELRGGFVSARSIGENVHIVTSSWLDHSSFTRFFNAWDTSIYPEKTTEEDYKVLAMEQLNNRTSGFVDQLVSELECGSTQQIALLQNSKDILPFGNVFESLNTIYSFAAADFANTIKSINTVLPTTVNHVYSSADNMVLAANGWFTEVEEDGATSSREESYFFVYKLEGATATALTLAKAPGGTLNQFSMGEHDGHLQVATTINAVWGFNPETEEFGQTTESFSQVSIFEIKDTGGNEATMVGHVSNLGLGERIYAVRFMGARGFVVTFRQIDPFYSLDLSDATNPTVEGELKIPGFSNYLHPVGEDLILGVGQQADEETGRQTGLKISLFDVSDLSNPVEATNPYVEDGGTGSSSSAQYDHKGFRYLKDSKLLILPLSVYDWSFTATDETDTSDFFDGFRIYSVNPEEGIEQYFDIAHASNDFYYGCYSYASLTPRSLVFDGDIVTLKGHSILSHDLTLRQADAEPVNLDEDIPQDKCFPEYFPIRPMVDCPAC